MFAYCSNFKIFCSLYRFTTMNQERYEDVQNTPDFRVFTFISKGRHGDLLKVAHFDEIDSSTFNLALGTILDDGSIDYDTTTNNGDRNKILVTVARIVYLFTEKHTGKDVFIRGSDYRRNLLYQRAISYAYGELSETFNIYGGISVESEEYEPFDKNKNYSGFLIERKSY